MKKYNKNSILFFFAVLFVLTGFFGSALFDLAKVGVKALYALKQGDVSKIVSMTNDIERALDSGLSYHALVMDLNSIKENLLGTRVAFKSDMIVVKSESGSLTEQKNRIDEESIRTTVSRIIELQEFTEENGAHFLYCVAPRKELYEVLPGNIENYFEANYSSFISQLRASGVVTLDLSETFDNAGLTGPDIFYYTDHHWKTGSGFLATRAICEELQKYYQFEFDEALTDIQNYHVELYPNWFLGSQGKKVGRYFTWHGPDDFELITPEFQTDLTEEQPYSAHIRSGSFEESVLFMNNLVKNHYRINSYATYSGGDFYLQIMRNNLNPNGKKVLLLRDSYAYVVAPFLALQTGEIHVCDMREVDWIVGDKINLEKYFEEIKPDYVIVLYSGILSMDESSGKYNFFVS